MAVVLLAFGVQIIALWNHWPWYAMFPILLLLRQLHLVEHNHSHLHIFYSRFLNDLLGRICYLSNGVPLEFYELHHVRNHHAYNQKFDKTEKDWSSMFGFTGTHYPDRPINQTYYVLSFPVITICQCLIEIARAPGTKLFWRFIYSTGFVIIASAVMLVINPTGYLFFFVIPWFIMYFGLGNNNYQHHHGCAMSNEYNSSNVFTSLPYQLLGFYIGYHVAHHINPSLHWSKLPMYHDTIKVNIPGDNFRPVRPEPGLEEKSI